MNRLAVLAVVLAVFAVGLASAALAVALTRDTAPRYGGSSTCTSYACNGGSAYTTR